MINFYDSTLTEISSALIIFSIIFSFILQIAIVYVYKKTHKGLSYSPSFVFTLVIIGVIGTVVMMVVQNNLVGAFALLGAFSIIRFRTILKETRDIAFVFFALVIGIAVGTGNHSIALIATVMISAIILFLDKYNIGGAGNNLGYIITFNAGADVDMEKVKSTLSKYSDTVNLLQTRTYGVDMNTYVFSVKLKDSFDSTEIIAKLGGILSITDVEIVTGEHNIEY